MPGLDVEISQESVGALPMLREISIAFRVEKILAVIPPDPGLTGFLLQERPVEEPYAKDYDEITGAARPCASVAEIVPGRRPAFAC